MRRLSYCLFVALLASITSLNSQTTWNGLAGDLDWFNAGNWTAGVPSLGNNATIPSGEPVDINLTSNTNFDFIVDNEGLIQVFLNGFRLRIRDNMTNGAAGMIIISGNNNGAFINRETITNEGTIILNPCAQFWARNNSSLSNIGAGTFTNDGIIYELGSGLVAITDGNGIVLNDLNIAPSPTALCAPDFSIDLDQNEQASITLADIDAGSFASYCSILPPTVSQTDFDCDDVGDNTIILEVTDLIGNTATCQTIVTVRDTVYPEITCPITLERDLNPGECDEIVEFDFLLSASDNCGSPSISQTDGTGLSSGDAFPIGTTWLTFEASDGQNTDECIFSVVINEFVPNSNGLGCHEQINVSIGFDCYELITPAHVLAGDYGCHDDFQVNISETGTDWVDENHLGKLLTVHVIEIETGNYCWGKALIEEKSAPTIENCDDVLISCLEDSRPTIEGGDVSTPYFSDCSGIKDFFYIDAMIAGGCNESYQMKITRIWTVTDLLDNVANCEQEITVERVTLLNNAPTCPDDFLIECDPDVTYVLDPDLAGHPTLNINGIDVPILENAPSVCGITASFSDDTLSKCGVAYTIIRQWLVADWCLPFDGVDNPWSCTQRIDFEDTSGPEVITEDNLLFSPNGDCRAMPILPAAEINDCSASTVTILTPVGPINGNGGQVPAPGITIGDHDIIYKVSDPCGNTTLDTISVTVEDDLDPYMICIQKTVVGLTNDGTAYSFPPSFDNGSYDNCGPIDLKVRRMDDGCFADTTFNDYVRFCCDDIGTTVMVVVRGYDWFGHHSECMVEVTVQDKLDPFVQCPPDITLDCGDDYNNLSLTGNIVTDFSDQTLIDGIATDNCGNLIIDYSDEFDIECGTGTIERTWEVSDMGGATIVCTQIITLEDSNPYDGTGIIWPSDTTIYDCISGSDPIFSGEPIVPPGGPCADLFIGFEDEIITAVQDACLKIFRTWEVIDWCQYDPNSGSQVGRWSYTQVIKIEDTAGPIFENCDDLTFCNFKPDCGLLTLDLSVDVKDVCSGDQIELSWEVDLYDDGSVDDSGLGQHIGGEYGIGTHRITYFADDGCGNISSCSFVFTIEDCRKPVVVCQQLVVEIMQTGEVMVFPEQLDSGSSTDNCTADDDLQFSFSADINDHELVLDCDNIGQNNIEIWVTDEAGNQDFCVTNIILQDNMNACNQDSLVVNLGGQISNWENESVEDVLIELSSTNTLTVQTDFEGTYEFLNLPTGYDYTITPSLDENPVNGVTTFDLVLLNRHILGTQILDSPYKLIAADINNSGAITVSDMVEMRKLILFVLDDFSNNTSWRFVESDYTFLNPNNPLNEAYPEISNVNNLTDDMMTGDFTAIKIGDLNGTAQTSSLTDSEDRNDFNDFSLYVDNQDFKGGETVKIPIYGKDLQSVLGYQFTLNFDTDKLEFLKINPTENTNADNFGLTMTDEGAVTVSWHNSTNTHFQNNADATLFNIEFRAKSNGKLSEILSINSRFTKAEAYDLNEEILNVELHFNNEQGAVVASEQFLLFQNIPNPVRNETVIGFNLPVATTAALTIVDMSGKVIKRIQKDCVAGYNTISISEGDLEGSGVLYYQLETPTHTATRKMTVIK